MAEEQLPEMFSHFWKMEKQLPEIKPLPREENIFSKEWTTFLEAVSNRVTKDLRKTK
jgi:hypothetical protein